MDPKVIGLGPIRLVLERNPPGKTISVNVDIPEGQTQIPDGGHDLPAGGRGEREKGGGGGGQAGQGGEGGRQGGQGAESKLLYSEVRQDVLVSSI